MLRLRSDSSRLYPGRPHRHATLVIAAKRPVRHWLPKPWRMEVCCLSMRANSNSKAAGKAWRVLQ